MENPSTVLADDAIAPNLASTFASLQSSPLFSFISSLPTPPYYVVILFSLLSSPLFTLVFFSARVVFANLRLHFSGLRHVPRPSVGGYSLVTRVFRNDPEETADWMNSQFALLESPLLYISGPLFSSNIFVHTPSAIRTLSRGVGMAKGHPFVDIITSFTGPGSILAVEGSKHSRLRRAISPTLTHDHVTTHFTESFFSEAHKLCERLQQNSGGHPLLLVRTAAFRVVVDACFGNGLLSEKEIDELFELYHIALTADPWLTMIQFVLRSFPVKLPYHLVSRSDRARRELRGRVQGICERAVTSNVQKHEECHETQEERERELGTGKKQELPKYSLLHHMVMSLDDDGTATTNDSIRSSSSSSSKRLSVSELTSNVLSFLLAGQATTTMAVTWVLYLLGKYPEWQARLYDEICFSFDAEHENDVEKLKMVDKLPVLHAIIKETLRLYPPLTYITRSIASESTEGGVTVDGYFLPNGTEVRVPVLALQTVERVWGNDAKMFNPQRWIDEGDNDGEKKLMWATFWFGNHGCVGQRFAMLEMKVFVLTAVRKMSVSIDPAKDGEPIRWGTATTPKEMKVYFEKR